MLTDSEVDRRFGMLMADLNSTVQTVDWPGVSEPAERHSPDELNAGAAPDVGIGALRVLAAAVALAMCAAGIIVARAFDLGAVMIVVWFALVVPGVTLATLLLVDRIRHQR